MSYSIIIRLYSHTKVSTSNIFVKCIIVHTNDFNGTFFLKKKKKNAYLRFVIILWHSIFDKTQLHKQYQSQLFSCSGRFSFNHSLDLLQHQKNAGRVQEQKLCNHRKVCLSRKEIYANTYF